MSPRGVQCVAPRRKTRGLPKDAVPYEVRDASLTLCRTKKDARQDGVGGLFRIAPALLFPKGVEAKDPVN